jgi:hypothetical protein
MQHTDNIATIPDYRLVLFPASRELSAKEIMQISEQLYEFLSTWQAHGKDLVSSFKIEYKQFVMVCVDETAEIASGCSIDALTRFIKGLDESYQLGFFDRMKACFLENNQVKTLKLSDFKKALREGQISPEAKIFNFNATTFNEYQDNFLQPLHESWAAVFVG